jgi:hypothetical protein
MLGKTTLRFSILQMASNYGLCQLMAHIESKHGELWVADTVVMAHTAQECVGILISLEAKL